MTDELYREIILDHYRNPQFRRAITGASLVAGETNPLCGDAVTFYLELDEEQRVREASWQGEGCAISLAAADMLAERLVGMPLDEVGRMGTEDVLAMLGIELQPARLKCALLALSCVHKGMREHGWLGQAGSR